METLTAAEIARRLSTPESTVRYHARRFDAYVPTVGHGRGKRYRPEALDALRFIGEQLHVTGSVDNPAPAVPDKILVPLMAVAEVCPVVVDQPFSVAHISEGPLAGLTDAVRQCPSAASVVPGIARIAGGYHGNRCHQTRKHPRARASRADDHAGDGSH
jgi:hypothetical protein